MRIVWKHILVGALAYYTFRFSFEQRAEVMETLCMNSTAFVMNTRIDK